MGDRPDSGKMGCGALRCGAMRCGALRSGAMRGAAVALLFLLGAAAPAAPAVPANRANPAIERLLSALHAASNGRDAGAIAARLERTWENAGTPAVTLLLRSGQAALAAGRFADALRDADAAVTLAPDLPAARFARAVARLHLGQRAGAERDLAQSLAIEARFLPALELEARLAAGRGDWTAAAAAWRRVLTLAPRLPGGQRTLRGFLRHAAGHQA